MLLMYLYHDTEGGSIGTVEVGPSESSCQWFLFIQCTQVEQCISQGSPGKQTTGDIIYIYICKKLTDKERERERLKKLAHAVVGATKSEICMAGHSLEVWIRLDVTSSGSKGWKFKIPLFQS